MMSSAAETITEARHWAEGGGPEAPAVAPPDDLPVIVIQRRTGWRWLDLGELWRYRELLFFLTWRDIKVRYKQTVLGAVWAVVQPFATMVVFSLFLGRTVGGEGVPDAPPPIPYPLFVFAGLLPWMFFANAITAASQSVIGNERLVTKIYFPRLLIPMGAVGAVLVDFLIAFGMLLVLMLYYGVGPGPSLALLPFIAAGLLVAALGMGTLLSALTVAYRDFRYVVPFAVQLWMFATPVIYLRPETVLGPTARAWMPLNPGYGLVANFRAAALGGPPDLPALGLSGAVSLLLLLAGCLYFRRVERTFADLI
jgi:lipopolysaccharide transport system permease protein